MSKVNDKKKIVKNINKELDILNDSLGRVATDLLLIQSGDGNAYWSGANAYNSMSSLAQQVNEGIDTIKEISSAIKKIK